jgi:hypothetical protein
MKDARVVPFEPRPARALEERVERAVERRVDDVVETNKALSSCEDLADLFEVWYRHIRVDPDRERPTPAELVYRVGPANDGVVFTTPERARYIASLNDALGSKTWGEFRSRIPAEEWEELMEKRVEIPGPDEPFKAEAVPGFCDGDWPPWLQKEIGHVLSEAILTKYAKHEMSVINGDFWHIHAQRPLKPSRRSSTCCARRC